MADILEMEPTGEQREEIARNIVQGLMPFLDGVSKDEREAINEIISGRAVTVGRLEILREIERKYLAQ